MEVEVTEEDFRTFSAPTVLPVSKPRRLFRSLRPRPRKSHRRQAAQPSDVMSTGDLSRAIDGINQRYPLVTPLERDTVTLSGLRSVSTYHTFSSKDTVKISNRHKVAAPLAAEESSASSPTHHGTSTTVQSTKHRTPWKSFKKALGVGKGSTVSNDALAPVPLRSRAPSAGSTQASTVHSEPLETLLTTTVDLRKSDQLKRGRLDGMDVLSLGLAFCRIHPLPKEASAEETTWPESSTGVSHCYTTETAVQKMLRCGAGHGMPDIVLEGFCEEDRWILRIEQGLNPPRLPSAVESLQVPPLGSNSVPEDNGAPALTASKLWSRLWGKDPTPASRLPAPEEFRDEDTVANGEDPMLDLAAANSIPIDVDEDTFIVSTPDHLQAIHAIVSVPISNGKFGSAVRILKRMLRGLDSAAASNNAVRKNLRGATCHNIGLLRLWQEKYDEAQHYFFLATKARKDCPLVSERDKAVTMVRYGQSLFATKRFSASLQCFEKALELTEDDQLSRAKILVNAGVSSYHLGEFQKSLDLFTQALAIQRSLLDGPIRRESIVYGASMTLCNMGKLYVERCDNDMACLVYEEALLLQKTAFRKEHPIIIEGLQNLAFAKACQLQYATAIKVLDKCRHFQARYYKASNAAPVMETCGWLAHLCKLDGQTARARTLYEAVHVWQKEFLPETHHARQRVEGCLEQLPSKLTWL